MDSGKARSHRVGGVLPAFRRKEGISEYLLRKYSDSPRPSGTPLINAGGKKSTFLDKQRRTHFVSIFRYSAPSGKFGNDSFFYLPKIVEFGCLCYNDAIRSDSA